MPTLEERIKFAEENIITKEGRRFSLEKRQWVIEQFWRPIDSWKLWPADKEKLCGECKTRATEMVEWSPELIAELEAHRSEECAGLVAEPIMLIVLNLPRREGKTVNTMGYVMGEIFKAKNKSVTLVASAGRQTKRLFEENYEAPINNNKKLKKACQIVGDSIRVAHTKSVFTWVDSSHRSITGTGRTLIIIDEARDVDPRVAAALIPSMRDQNGMECRHGHMHTGVNSTKVSCDVCGEPLVPWFGRLVIISSSGLLEGNERDWFQLLVDQLEESPHPNCHVYRSEQVSNPAVSAKSTKMIEEVFGANEAMKSYIDVEMTNVARQKGEDFVTISDIKAVTDGSLHQHEGFPGRCFGFLDTSLTKETTSLVMVAEAEGSKYPWERIKVLRIDMWCPPKLPGGVIDPQGIQAHLDQYIPLFPGLVDLNVDVRAMTWAVDLVKYCHQQRPGWGKKVKAFHGGQAERDTGWNQLEYRILHRKVAIPDHKDLQAELRGVRRVKRPDGSWEIRDRSRKTRHADIAEGLATLCYRVYLEQTKPQASIKEVNHRAAANDILNRLYRPSTKGLRGGADSF